MYGSVCFGKGETVEMGRARGGGKVPTFTEYEYLLLLHAALLCFPFVLCASSRLASQASQ